MLMTKKINERVSGLSNILKVRWAQIARSDCHRDRPVESVFSAGTLKFVRSM